MNRHSEDSPATSKPSNNSRLEAWRLVGKACVAAMKPQRGRAREESLLRLALDATGAERAYLVERSGGGAAQVRRACCRREDGEALPSRTALLCAAASAQPFICTDTDANNNLSAGLSVRSMNIRSILAAPVPDGTGKSLLLLDSSSRPTLPYPTLRELLESFASLLALLPRDRFIPPAPDDGLAGKAANFRAMLEWVGRVAASELPILIQGETGSGKEGIARRLHLQSNRAEGPFIPVNCTALTETLLDAELFGSLRGSYTGADRNRPGLFRRAHAGTLFLDEIGDASPVMQSKLLRALQEKRVRPVGGEEEIAVDTRIVAATNQDLERLVRGGLFRADLLHRLAVLVVRIPPLRDRLEDLPLLVATLAPRLHRETCCRSIDLAPSAWRRLRAHTWPGNVRELHAVLARAALRAAGDRITAEHIGPLRSPVPEPEACTERAMIERALARSQGMISEAARRIGWSRQKLYRRMEALSIRHDRQSRTTSSASSTFQ